MFDETISTDSPVGKRLYSYTGQDVVSYIMFDNKKIKIVTQITIGRSVDNDLVIDSKLASRHHAIIQKIKDVFFIKDMGSTNGTFVNDELIPKEKYVKLYKGDKISIGSISLVVS